MNDLTFDALKYHNRKRCEQCFHPLFDWTPTDWATAVAGETGEMCNLVKKLRRGDNIDIKEIGKELADIIIYADLLAQRLHLDLGACVREKFNEKSVQYEYENKL